MINNLASAIIVVVLCLSCLAGALVWRMCMHPEHGEHSAAVQGAEETWASSALNQGNALLDPARPSAARDLPAHPTPVSSSVAQLMDRERENVDRLRVLTDGALFEVGEVQDMVAVRRLLLDPSESDTLRNEAANLLARSQVVERHDDLRLIAEHLGEGYRFRSFAVQHVGADYVAGVAMVWGAKQAPGEWLLRLAGDDAEHPAVRREALWPLAQVGDERALVLAEALIHHADATWVHDLCCRIAETFYAGLRPTALRAYPLALSELAFRGSAAARVDGSLRDDIHPPLLGASTAADWADAIYAIALRPRAEREAPADSNCCGGSSEPGRDPAAIVEPNRLAALRALVALGDERVGALLQAALIDANPHVQSFARQALADVAAASPASAEEVAPTVEAAP